MSRLLAFIVLLYSLKREGGFKLIHSKFIVNDPSEAYSRITWSLSKYFAQKSLAYAEQTRRKILQGQTTESPGTGQLVFSQ